MSESVQVNAQDILNNLKEKLSDTQMEVVMAEATVEAYRRRLEEKDQIISDLNNRLRELAQTSDDLPNEVIEGE